jgi:hypothetical protein
MPQSFIYFLIGSILGATGVYKYNQLQQYQKDLQYSQSLYNQIKYNQQLVESYNVVQQKNKEVLNDKTNLLLANKELINRNNRITKQLVQYIQTGTDAGMQASDTPSITNPNATIPAVDFGIWAAGLVAHDTQCINQLNNLIKVIQ